ncbi:MAG: transporter substrate-binding domain-containing protein [Gammaproteobacteria bacterium]|nr:transporter substrate-binding domain-containing protein [Gammaproteobacteria bacterium]
MKILLGDSEKRTGTVPARQMMGCTVPKVLRRVILLALLSFSQTTASGPEALPEGLLGVKEPWFGDFDEMVERRTIRALVVYNKMFYFLDGATQRGIAYELLGQFEKFVNRKVKSGTLKPRVIFIPVARDQLLPALIQGKGDIAAANLTITPERRQLVDFSNPFVGGVDEILVTGPTAPPLETIEGLSGQKIRVRRSSSYYSSLRRLNERFLLEDREPVEILPADEYLEDSDLLEMVNNEMLPMVIMDSHKATFWGTVFEQIQIHPDISVSSGGEIGWAFRKDSPKLKAVVDEFVKGHKKGTLLGNILLRRYLKKNKWTRNAMNPKELKKLRNTIDLFQKYAEEYDFDYLMIAALAYQESQLDHKRKSSAGAVGIMQLLPSTARDPNVNIKDISKLENNIKAGNKYLHFLQNRYFSDPEIEPLDRMLLSFAAYNAGPAKVARLRRQAAKEGLDPNRWFSNVELIAAKRIGRETVQYVSNIYKYYIAYRSIINHLKAKAEKSSKSGVSDSQG